MDIYERNEHVEDFKSSIKHIKEQEWATCHCLSYKKITIVMTRELIYGIIHVNKALPQDKAMNHNLSPGTIVDGRIKINFNSKFICFVRFAYVHVNTRNTMKSRSRPTIALRPSNEDGGRESLNSETKKVMHSYNWNEFPVA